MWPFHALFLKREQSFSGGLFYSQPIRHVSHMQVLYIVIFVHWLGLKELEFFVVFSFLSFNVSVAILFIFYSNIRPAQFNRNQTLHLFGNVCVRVHVCLYECKLRPFVVCTAACSKANVYTLHSSLRTSFLAQTNAVQILKAQFGFLKRGSVKVLSAKRSLSCEQTDVLSQRVCRNINKSSHGLPVTSDLGSLAKNVCGTMTLLLRISIVFASARGRREACRFSPPNNVNVTRRRCTVGMISKQLARPGKAQECKKDKPVTKVNSSLPFWWTRD